jgi:hypothetical protein
LFIGKNLHVTLAIANHTYFQAIEKFFEWKYNYNSTIVNNIFKLEKDGCQIIYDIGNQTITSCVYIDGDEKIVLDFDSKEVIRPFAFYILFIIHVNKLNRYERRKIMMDQTKYILDQEISRFIIDNYWKHNDKIDQLSQSIIDKSIYLYCQIHKSFESIKSLAKSLENGDDNINIVKSKEHIINKRKYKKEKKEKQQIPKKKSKLESNLDKTKDRHYKRTYLNESDGIITPEYSNQEHSVDNPIEFSTPETEAKIKFKSAIDNITDSEQNTKRTYSEEELQEIIRRVISQR